MPTRPSSQNLGLRRRPVQTRSAETFDQILFAAAALLEEVGWDGFNTNRLAERTGIGVRTIYRYFPNKLAVVSTLARRMTDEWDEWLSELARPSESEDALIEAWPGLIDVFIEGLRKQPGGVAVRRAMAASPTLREIDREDNERLSNILAGELKRLRPERATADARTAARLLIETAVAAIDHALVERPAETRRTLTELKRMQTAYLMTWLANP